MSQMINGTPTNGKPRRELPEEDFEIALPISLTESLYTYAIQFKANLDLNKRKNRRGSVLSGMIELDLQKYEETRQRQLNGRRIPR